MRRTMFVAGLAVAALALAQVARAQDRRAGDRINATDQKFVRQATAGGLAEVNLARLAVDKASNADVKKFAKHMLDDHDKANKDLLAILNKKGLPAAPTMDRQHQQLSVRLTALSGVAFDRQYMSGQVKDHEDTVKLFEDEAKNGQDKDLKAFAEKTLPTLREHLDMAKKAAAKVGAGAR